MKDSIESSKEATDKITDLIINNFEAQGLPSQMKSSIHPIIANAMFSRDNELLEQERFKTLISLSRILDDENINKAIEALKYTLTIK